MESTRRKEAHDRPSVVTESDSSATVGALRAQPRRRFAFHCCKGRFQVLGHYVNIQFLLLWLVEFLAAYGGGYFALKTFEPLLGQHLGEVVVHRELLIATATLSFGFLALGLYDARQRERWNGILFRILLALVFSALALMALDRLLPYISWTDAQGLVYGLGAVAPILVIRPLFYRFIDGRILLRNVLVLGAGRRAAYIQGLRRKADRRGFRLLGFVATPDCRDIQVDRSKLLNADGTFCVDALALGADEIVIAVDDRRQSLPIDELLDCRMSGLDVIDAIDFFEREQALLHLELLQPGWLIHAKGFRRSTLRAFAKRSFDLVVSLMLLAVLGIPALFTGLAIWLESRGRGPIFYRQIRTGLNGRPFEVIKFRSMRTDAEADGKARWAQKNDPRVTRVGRVIRKYRLDEIPQLWNVIRGDMSLVGPRPERPEFVEQLDALNPLYHERHRVRPGLTGWAQVSYPYGATPRDAMQKLQYDLYYIKNQTLFFDFYILVQTVEVVLFRKGAQ